LLKFVGFSFPTLASSAFGHGTLLADTSALDTKGKSMRVTPAKHSWTVSLWQDEGGIVLAVVLIVMILP